MSNQIKSNTKKKKTKTKTKTETVTTWKMEYNPNLPPEYQNELWRDDVSIYPSYSRLDFPYFVICRRRLNQARIKYNKQFEKEVRIIESLQPLGYSGLKVQRQFCNGILKIDVDKVPKLTKTEQERIQRIIEFGIPDQWF